MKRLTSPSTHTACGSALTPDRLGSVRLPFTIESVAKCPGPGTNNLVCYCDLKEQNAHTGIEGLFGPIQSLGQTERAATAADGPETAQTEASLPATTEPATATSVAPHAPDVAPEKAPAKTKATKPIDLLVAQRDATTAQKAAPPGTPREGSKTSQVIAMLKREGGTTLEEIMTGWAGSGTPRGPC